MRVTHLVLLGLLLGTGLSLGACDTIDNLTNMLDTKKRMPGDRRPVFPDGVPGVEMGVPPEMMKGYQEKQQAESQAQTPPGAPVAGQTPAGQAQQTGQEPKPKKVVTRPKPKPAPSDTAQQTSQPPAQTQTAAWPTQSAQPAPAQAPAPWPGQQPQPAPTQGTAPWPGQR